MRSSRLVLSLAKEATILRPRGSWDIMKSSVKACFKLISSQNREDCLKLLNSGVINPNVLGIPMSLALYDEMSSPLWDDHRKDVEHFTEGAKMALERFHCLHQELENRYIASVIENDPDGQGAESRPSEKRTPEKNSVRLTRVLKAVQEAYDRDRYSICKEHKWQKEAESDPDSLAGQLRAMVTPDYFEFLKFGSAGKVIGVKSEGLTYDLENIKFYEKTVTNIVLLSARAQVVPPAHATPQNLRKLNEAESEKNDDILNKIYTDPLPVLAEIEVLYKMEWKRKEEPKMETLLRVAMFEGWLRSPDGKPLRWKLGYRRTAWEFI